MEGERDIYDLLQWVDDEDTALGRLHITSQLKNKLVIGNITTCDGDDVNTIRCSRCKTCDPVITPRQIRSADEGMTIFYTCANVECGHRWKER